MVRIIENKVGAVFFMISENIEFKALENLTL